MPKKLIIILIVFLLLIGALTFFLFYQNKLGLFSNLVGKQTPETTTEEVKAPAIEKQGDFYVIRGRMEKPFKLSVDKTYMVGSLIIDGDPNQTVVRVTVSSTQDGNVAIATYEQTFAGVPKVTFRPILEATDLVQAGDAIEIRLNANIKSYTGREPNKHEIAIFDRLNELLKGNWAGLDDPTFGIFSQSIGYMNK